MNAERITCIANHAWGTYAKPQDVDQALLAAAVYLSALRLRQEQEILETLERIAAALDKPVDPLEDIL